jgi:hypothetical protein
MPLTGKMVGEPFAIKQGKPEGDGIIHFLIYELPDRQIPWRFLFCRSW